MVSFGRVTRAKITGQQSAGKVRNLGQKSSVLG